MKCLNCKRTATYRVENNSSDSQVFCRLHIPGFLNIKKDLGNRLTVLQADGSTISQEVITEKTVAAFASAPFVDAPVVDVTEEPVKKKKKETKETPVVEKSTPVVEPEAKVADTL